MKHGKKPTYEQRKFITAKGFDPRECLVVKDTPDEMWVRQRNADDSVMILHKGVDA